MYFLAPGKEEGRAGGLSSTFYYFEWGEKEGKPPNHLWLDRSSWDLKKEKGEKTLLWAGEEREAKLILFLVLQGLPGGEKKKKG